MGIVVQRDELEMSVVTYLMELSEMMGVGLIGMSEMNLIGYPWNEFESVLYF